MDPIRFTEWANAEALDALCIGRDAPSPNVLVENHPPRDFRAPSHTAELFDPATFPAVVDWIVGIAKAEQYEALAGSGHSGLLPMAAACYRLGLPPLAVRKGDERPKGDSNRVNGILPHRPLRYAIVDDFICSGETVSRIIDEVALAFPQATPVAVFMHRVRADNPETRYSFVDDNRSSLARRIGVEAAGRLKIHARHNLKD